MKSSCLQHERVNLKKWHHHQPHSPANTDVHAPKGGKWVSGEHWENRALGSESPSAPGSRALQHFGPCGLGRTAPTAEAVLAEFRARACSREVFKKRELLCCYDPPSPPTEAGQRQGGPCSRADRSGSSIRFTAQLHPSRAVGFGLIVSHLLCASVPSPVKWG